MTFPDFNPDSHYDNSIAPSLGSSGSVLDTHNRNGGFFDLIRKFSNGKIPYESFLVAMRSFTPIARCCRVITTGVKSLQYSVEDANGENSGLKDKVEFVVGRPNVTESFDDFQTAIIQDLLTFGVAFVILSGRSEEDASSLVQFLVGGSEQAAKPKPPVVGKSPKPEERFVNSDVQSNEEFRSRQSSDRQGASSDSPSKETDPKKDQSQDKKASDTASSEPTKAVKDSALFSFARLPFPSRVMELRDWDQEPGSFRYFYTCPTGERRLIRDCDAVSIHYQGYTSVDERRLLQGNGGSSCLEKALEDAFFLIWLREHQVGMVRRDPTEARIIFLGDVTPKQVDDFRGFYAATRRQSEPLIFGGKGTPEILPLAPTSDDEAFMGLAKNRLAWLAAAFDLPGRYLNMEEGDDGRATADASADSGFQHAILPMAQTFYGAVATIVERLTDERLTVEITRAEPRNRLADSASALQAWQGGLITRDEARLKSGYPALHGEKGEEFFPIGGGGGEAPPPPGGNPPEGSPPPKPPSVATTSAGVLQNSVAKKTPGVTQKGATVAKAPGNPAPNSKQLGAE
jgi:hypothetical protein